MIAVKSVVSRRARSRDARMRTPGGVKLGRMGRVFVQVNQVPVRDRRIVLDAIGRKI